MAAYFCVQSAVFHRTFLRGFRLRQRTTVSPLAAVGLRLLSASAPGDKKQTILESTEEYKFVKRLIPQTRVPIPPHHDGPAPSGWIPPAETPPALPYMIRRSRMHNIPVYTDLTHGNRKMTLIRKVEGDLWALEKDVKEYLKGLTGKELPTQVNEVTMTLKIKGHFDKELKDWLLQKGF